MSIQQPAKIGRYEIAFELGRGAMGRVYRAFDPNIGRHVALKVIPTESGDPEMGARFRREAQAAGILSHPNIVTIFDAGSDQGFLYIAMELVEGESLQKMLSRGPLTVEQAVSLAEQTGAALDHAHARGIVHRDVKPANIMVVQMENQQGHAKVTDFGVAKIGAAGMTTTGQVLGTPSYLAPEVVKGGTADARSDIFSLGVVLYEMLTGIKPFGGDTLSTVIYRILSEPPLPPASVVAALPAGFNYVLLKALAKDPKDRYGSCAELVVDLKNHHKLQSQGELAAAATFRTSYSADPLAQTARFNPGTLPTPRGVSGSFDFLKKGPFWAAVLAVVLIGAGFWWRSRHASAPLPASGQSAAAAAVQTSAQGDSPPGLPAKPPANLSDSAAVSAPGAPPPASPGAAALPDSRPSAFGDPGTTPAGATADAAAAAQSPAASTDAAKGRVLIRTQPPGASIFVNGDATSYRSPVNFALAPGHYEITIVREGFNTQRKEIDVESNRAVTMDIELRRGGFIRRLNPFRR